MVILNDAFKDCKNLKKITLKHFENKVDHEETVGSLTVGNGAFSGCTSLNEIVNIDRLTTVGNRAFYGCTSLTSLDISGLRIASSEVFADCTNLATVTMSAQTQLGRSMFKGCTKLNNVVIDTPVLPYGVFEGCTNLTNVSFAEGLKVKSIGDAAFANCVNLTQITLPDGDYTLGADVFSGCKKLATVNLSKDTHIVGDILSPFSACEVLSAINIDSANAYYASVDGVLYSKDMQTLVLVPVLAEVNDSNIPASVKFIGASAFADNKLLTCIELSR